MKFFDLNLSDPGLRTELDQAYGRVMDSGWMILGPELAAFETEFAAWCGAAHGVGVGNGLDALTLTLRAAGVQAGAEVIVPAHTFAATWMAVEALGAVPVPVEVNAATYTLDADACAAAVTDRTVAIVPVSLYGHPLDLDPLMALAQRRGLFVLEDAAQSHGSTYQGRRTGAGAHATAFSFYPTKNLGAVGDGGAVTCNDERLAENARKLRQYGWSRKYTNELAGGRNSRLDEMQAAFLCSLLPDLDARNARRREIANRYSLEINHADIQVPAPAGNEYVAHLFVVQSRQRDRLASHLQASGVASDIHYPIPDHRQPVHGDRFAAVGLPATEALCERVLTLPCFPEMTEDEVGRVIAACNAWRSDGAGMP